MSPKRIPIYIYSRGIRPALARLYRAIFKPAARYPADPRAVFILALSVFSGLTALALNAAPDSLEQLLPEWAVVTWGLLLAGGAVVTLVGMYFQSLNGILTEQVGSVMVGATTVFYSSVVFYTLGGDAVQSVGIIMAWGLSCFIRWAQLQALIIHSHRKGIELEIEKRIHDQILHGDVR